MPISEETYVRVALEETDETWELIDGWLRAKPGVSVAHNDVASFLSFSLQDQLDRAVFRGRINGSRLRCSCRDYYVPDVMIVPTALS